MSISVSSRAELVPIYHSLEISWKAIIGFVVLTIISGFDLVPKYLSVLQYNSVFDETKIRIG